MVCNPGKWMWGLIPLALVAALATYATREIVERDLTDKSTQILRDAGYYWAVPTFVGRDALLQGISFSGEDRDGALQVLKNIRGIRNVKDDVRVIASPETYAWLANKKEERIQLRGYVPTEEDRKTIIGFIKAALPEYDVDDKMALAGGAPKREVWLGSVSYALVQLAQMRSGNVQLSGNKLTVTGTAASSEAYRKLNDALTKQLPATLKLVSAQVRPPVVKPYEWRVKFTGSQISFAGYAPSEIARDFVLEQTRNLFPGADIKNAMELGSGAPESWSWAVSASLTQLNRLKSGRVKMKDAVIEFEGVAADDLTAKDVTSLIRNSLPGSFLTSEKITVEQKTQSPPQPANQ